MPITSKKSLNDIVNGPAKKKKGSPKKKKGSPKK